MTSACSILWNAALVAHKNRYTKVCSEERVLKKTQCKVRYYSWEPVEWTQDPPSEWEMKQIPQNEPPTPKDVVR